MFWLWLGARFEPVERPSANAAEIEETQEQKLRPEDMGLYLFLALAADRNGLSCWRLDRIEREIPCFDRHALWDARNRLAQWNLIAYRPWRQRDSDGCYQLLAVDRSQARPEDDLSPELAAVLDRIGQRLQTR